MFGFAALLDVPLLGDDLELIAIMQRKEAGIGKTGTREVA